jgi:serine 3-dehydrogenase (NADP+)
MDPAGRVAMITGATSGIGLATARLFAEAGARLVLVARGAERLAEVAASLPGGGHLVVAADLGVPQATQDLADRALRECGCVDILINNAGVGLAAPVAELRAEDLLQAVRVNLLGPLALTQALLPAMRARGRGQIMFVSSVVGLRALPYLGGYAATKAAIDRLSESLRVELRGSGVAVTLVRPGTTDTGFAERRLGQGREVRRAGARGATPAQVAGAILRAARREPRVAYVSWRDRLTVLAGLLAPGLTDRLLARSFSWERGS